MSYFPTLRLCPCGSGEYGEPRNDARGIYLTTCCDRCLAARMAQFRPEVLTDPNYETDEPIEEDE
jgi:hypothetical protein